MIIEDDRTIEEKATHKRLIIGTDKFLSGWGKAENGKSYAVWACKLQDAEKVMQWVENRNDMKNIRSSYGKYRPSGKGHCHIYVVNENHPSLNAG